MKPWVFGGKALQKRLLSVLLDRTTFLTFVAAIFILTVSALSFGEAWLQWSSDKYAAVFNSFSDNLKGRSMQSRLCQHVPIDVVYTWVNGSDPWFQDSLKHYREHAADEAFDSKRHLTDECAFDDCVPSHFLSTKMFDDRNVVVNDIKDQNTFLSKLVYLENYYLKCKEGKHQESEEDSLFPDQVSQADDPHNHGEANRTFLVMEDVAAALEVARGNYSSFELGLRTFPLDHAVWTSDPYALSSYPMKFFLIVKKLPITMTRELLLTTLPSELSNSVTGVWIFKDKGIAVIQSEKAQHFVDKSFPSKDKNQMIQLKQAYIVLSLPQFSQDDSHAFNRFIDREELRYSLRSIEKYAPWVRRIFLVTNGQIPYWLNLDHPRLTIVTHEQIFENQNDLPTFSSPAIEANIYRIPGLSEKFLYMNDDVFLGKEVWPEDFYTEHSGQKIYFSWPLPDCATGCPNSWIKDGYCDRVCNTTECMFDGGDCLGEQPRFGYSESEDLSRNHWTEGDEGRPSCAQSCLDNWLADKFCDESCNTVACGYDAGDCGVSHFSRLHEIAFNYNASSTAFNLIIPKSIAVAYVNLSKLFGEYSEVGVVPFHHKAVRFVGLSHLSKVITILLFPDQDNVSFNFTLQAKNSKVTVIHEMFVEADTTGYVAPLEDEEDLRPDLLNNQTLGLQPHKNEIGSDALEKEQAVKLPDNIEQAVSASASSSRMASNLSSIHLNEADRVFLEILNRQLADEEITLKGYYIKKEAILAPYLQQRPHDGSSRNLLSFSNSNESAPNGIISRKLLDVYGDSLLHVNRVYNLEYGHVARMVVSHVPHLVDKNVFDQMHQKFSVEWQQTSQHRLRQRNDMQFAFSYFHYLISETRNFDALEIFNEFDTDQSGTWSDREIRTLLTRIHDLPLTLEYIKSFEKLIVDCNVNLTNVVMPSTPPFERYFDSDLPIVSADLVVRCSPLVLFLKDNFRDRRRYKYEVVPSSSTDVAFKRLTSNLSQVVQSLDDLRRNPKKFFCLNDNTDTSRTDDNRLIHAILVDYLESVLPVPSTFELPPDYRNKFTHTHQLERWKFYRSALTICAYVCVIFLLCLFLAGYMDLDLELFLQSIFRKIMKHPSPRKTTKRYTV